MRSGANPYNNEAGLVDKYIGTAYENVKIVAGEIPLIRHVSENMQVVYDFTAAKDAFEAFIENPDFLPWLIANQENMEDLSELLASLVQDYAPLAGATFTGPVQIGERGIPTRQVYMTGNTPVIGATNIWAHEVNPSKIVGIQGTVLTLHGRVEALIPEGMNVRVWCDDEYLRIAVDPEATDYGNRPFHVILTIID